MNFNRIKKNYDSHLWTKGMVKTAVKKGIITETEYTMITGESYGRAGSDGNTDN